MAADVTMPAPVVSAPGNGSATGNKTASDKTTGIADNFQTFLTLLTTQLQHQNPLDPLDTNQFTQQLVQFAGIEQQLKSNEQLKALVEIEKSAQATQALVYVGNTVAVDGSKAQFDKSATWNFKSEKDTTATITITHAAPKLTERPGSRPRKQSSRARHDDEIYPASRRFAGNRDRHRSSAEHSEISAGIGDDSSTGQQPSSSSPICLSTCFSRRIGGRSTSGPSARLRQP